MTLVLMYKNSMILLFLLQRVHPDQELQDKSFNFYHKNKEKRLFKLNTLEIESNILMIILVYILFKKKKYFSFNLTFKLFI